jgi:hypothetical protein
MSNTKVADTTTEINDIRNPADFRSISFSNFKKTEVKTQLIENIKNGKIEPACYWTAELICAGHYMDIWEIILHFLGKYIHLGNPKLAVYLERRFQIFRNIVSQGSILNELNLRNYNNIRKMFAEIICILTFSQRKYSIEPVKINRIEEFDMTFMTERLKATSDKYIKPVFLAKDSKELYIPMNEFAYHISAESKNTLMACYWIEWLIEFDSICKDRKIRNSANTTTAAKKQDIEFDIENRFQESSLLSVKKDADKILTKEPCQCEKRNEYNVENKFKRDIIWLVWDILIHISSQQDNPFNMNTMKSLCELFCIKYTTAVCKKRRYILYYAVMVLTENIPTNIEIIEENNKPRLRSVVEKIDEIYRDIKKNEVSPNTDYLFSNLNEKEKNMEASMKKIEMMNSMSEFL